jgi:hypothetical protein
LNSRVRRNKQKFLDKRKGMSAPDNRVTITFPASEEELERTVAVAERSQHGFSPSRPSGSDAGRDGPVDLVRSMQVLRGVVTEVALFSETLRYGWGTLRRVYHALIDKALADYLCPRDDGDDDAKVIVGQYVAGQGASGRLSVADTEEETAEIVCHPHDIDRAREEIHELLEGFQAGAPFTLQRLSELVLEPEKQYANLDKYLNALTVVLSVSSLYVGVERRTARPELALGPVNE